VVVPSCKVEKYRKKWPALWWTAESCKEIVIAACFILSAQSYGCFELWGRRGLGKILPLRSILGAGSLCVLLCVNDGGCSGGSGRF